MRGTTGGGGGGGGVGRGGGEGGEIIQVQGGHIVRSIGRKDRHSKVYTAKGPRDRRVRLSAHTAIQFYDVQDQLGYDRPSKAVDWLIKKAKSAIDKLAELPPWHPTATTDPNPNLDANQNGTEMAIAEQSESSGYSFHQLHNNPSNDSNSFMATAPIDNDSLPDNMKSFFPTSSTTSSMNFQSNYPSHDHQLVSRSSTHSTEDLGLSLHSFQHQDLGHTPSSNDHHQTLFQGSGPVGYESNFQRMVSWGGNDFTSAENRGGFVFNPPAVLSPHHSLLAQGSSAFSQRGPLQSSFVQPIRAWNDLPMASSNATADHHRPQEIHQSFFFGSRFASDQGLPVGYSIPARIHGEEEQSVVSDRPSSSSPNSQH